MKLTLEYEDICEILQKHLESKLEVDVDTVELHYYGVVDYNIVANVIVSEKGEVE